MKIQLKRSSVLEGSPAAAKEPTAAQMEYGELAVNYNTDDPAIFIKDSNDNIIRIAGVNNIADDGQVEIPANPNPPTDPVAGNLWYNPVDGRLYVYYDDGNSEQWVDASPDSWNPTVIPDPDGGDNQPGTLDDRYVKKIGDNMTGDLTLGTDKITLDATDGSATFANGNHVISDNGSLVVATNPTNGAGSGCLVGRNGNVRVGRSATNQTFASYQVGTTSPTIEFLADGSSQFAGDMKIGITGSYTPSAPAIELNAAGSAKFAGSIQGLSFHGKRANENDVVFLATDEAGTTTSRGILIDRNGRIRLGGDLVNTNNATGNITLNADGSANFSGTITQGGGGFKAPGLSLAAQGTIYIGRPVTTNPVWAAYLAPDSSTDVVNDWTSRILANGMADFKGAFTAPNVFFNLEADDDTKYTATTNEDGEQTLVYNGAVLDVKDRLQKTDAALQALKTAAAAASDFAALKSAIATALADI